MEMSCQQKESAFTKFFEGTAYGDHKSPSVPFGWRGYDWQTGTHRQAELMRLILSLQSSPTLRRICDYPTRILAEKIASPPASGTCIYRARDPVEMGLLQPECIVDRDSDILLRP
jgi:hypothetical protein